MANRLQVKLTARQEIAGQVVNWTGQQIDAHGSGATWQFVGTLSPPAGASLGFGDVLAGIGLPYADLPGDFATLQQAQLTIIPGESLEAQGQLGEWRNPFSLQGVSIGPLALDLSHTTRPSKTNISLHGPVQFRSVGLAGNVILAEGQYPAIILAIELARPLDVVALFADATGLSFRDLDLKLTGGRLYYVSTRQRDYEHRPLLPAYPHTGFNVDRATIEVMGHKFVVAGRVPSGEAGSGICVRGGLASGADINLGFATFTDARAFVCTIPGQEPEGVGLEFGLKLFGEPIAHASIAYNNGPYTGVVTADQEIVGIEHPTIAFSWTPTDGFQITDWPMAYETDALPLASVLSKANELSGGCEQLIDQAIKNTVHTHFKIHAWSTPAAPTCAGLALALSGTYTLSVAGEQIDFDLPPIGLCITAPASFKMGALADALGSTIADNFGAIVTQLEGNLDKLAPIVAAIGLKKMATAGAGKAICRALKQALEKTRDLSRATGDAADGEASQAEGLADTAAGAANAAEAASLAEQAGAIATALSGFAGLVGAASGHDDLTDQEKRAQEAAERAQQQVRNLLTIRGITQPLALQPEGSIVAGWQPVPGSGVSYNWVLTAQPQQGSMFSISQTASSSSAVHVNDPRLVPGTVLTLQVIARYTSYQGAPLSFPSYTIPSAAAPLPAPSGVQLQYDNSGARFRVIWSPYPASGVDHFLVEIVADDGRVVASTAVPPDVAPIYVSNTAPDEAAALYRARVTALPATGFAQSVAATSAQSVQKLAAPATVNQLYDSATEMLRAEWSPVDGAAGYLVQALAHMESGLNPLPLSPAVPIAASGGALSHAFDTTQFADRRWLRYRIQVRATGDEQHIDGDWGTVAVVIDPIPRVEVAAPDSLQITVTADPLRASPVDWRVEGMPAFGTYSIEAGTGVLLAFAPGEEQPGGNYGPITITATSDGCYAAISFNATVLQAPSSIRKPQVISADWKDGLGERQRILSASAFASSSPELTQDASQWQVTTVSGNYDHPVYDSGPVAGQADSFTIPDGVLEPGTEYYWRVCYRAAGNIYSDWSDEGSFSLDAIVPFGLFVTTTADSGPGSLRQALLDAASLKAPCYINFELPAGSTIVIGWELTVLQSDLSIEGPGGGVHIDAMRSCRVFNIDGSSVSLTNLTIANGYVHAGAGLGGGMGITDSKVFLDNISFLNNAVNVRGEPGEEPTSFAFGGGLYVQSGTVVVSNSTFDGNRADGGAGVGKGGAIYVHEGADVTLENVALIRSEASSAGQTLRDNPHIFGTVTMDQITRESLQISFRGEPGSWLAMPQLTTPRQGHTATLLDAGRVLVVGGYASHQSPLSGAEIFDVADPRWWQPAGSMSVGRFAHTATRLSDGRVLVVGASSRQAGSLTVVEIYDPASGTWHTAAPLRAGRISHTATLLPDGTVLVAGGVGGGDLDSVEIYDPVSDAWGEAAPMHTPRFEHTATLLSDGTVLVVGGGRDVSTPEIYDPDSNTWTLTGEMSFTPVLHIAIRLDDGRALVAGGEPLPGGRHLKSAAIYDPIPRTWADVAPMNVERDVHTATLLPDGRVLVVGGYDTDARILADAEIYDPATGVWQVVAAMNNPHFGHTSTLLPGGMVLVAGGIADWKDGSWATPEAYTLPGQS